MRETENRALSGIRPHRKWLARGAFSALIAIGMAWLLVWYSGITLQDIWNILRSMQASFFLLIILSTILHFNLSALKWKFILDRTFLQRIPTPYSFSLGYTSLGSALGQFLPIQFSILLARSIATRIRDHSFLEGAGTSILDQAFDLLVPLIFLFPGLASIRYGWSTTEWAIVCILAMTISGFALYSFLPGLVRRISALVEPRQENRLQNLSLISTAQNGFRRIYRTGLLNGRELLTLYILSVFRLGNLALRAWLIATGLNQNISLSTFLKIMPGIQLSNLIAITPGNFGILEWTLVGLLTMVGINTGQATAFSFSYRIVATGAVLVAIALVGVWIMGLNFRGRKRSN